VNEVVNASPVLRLIARIAVAFILLSWPFARSQGTKQGIQQRAEPDQQHGLVDPGGATDASSATSVVYNAAAGLFFAAVRYHSFYTSPDGVGWIRLANQPGGAVLSTSAGPPQSASNNYACPIYRGEITVVPTRNEMYVWYVWYVYVNAYGATLDGGIWQSVNGGAP